MKLSRKKFNSALIFFFLLHSGIFIAPTKTILHELLITWGDVDSNMSRLSWTASMTFCALSTFPSAMTIPKTHHSRFPSSAINFSGDSTVSESKCWKMKPSPSSSTLNEKPNDLMHSCACTLKWVCKQRHLRKDQKVRLQEPFLDALTALPLPIK